MMLWVDWRGSAGSHWWAVGIP